MGDELTRPVDLEVDLNTMDETGLPWAFLDEAPDPAKIAPGTRILVGAGNVRVVATVVDIDDGIVHVQPLRGSVDENAHLLNQAKAS